MPRKRNIRICWLDCLGGMAIERRVMTKTGLSLLAGRLPRLTRVEARLLTVLDHLAPPEGLLASVALRLGDELGQEVLITPGKAHFFTPPPHEEERYLLRCQVELALLPMEGTVLIEIDLPLATGMIALLLGGESVGTTRPLSAIEGGLLSYLLLNVLDCLDGQWTSQVGLQPCLCSIRRGPDSVENRSRDSFFVLPLGFRTGSLSGAVQVFIPPSLIRELSARFNYYSPGRAVPSFTILKRIPVAGAVEIGFVELSAHEVGGLGNGDIILFDQLYPDFGSEGWTGTVKIRFGRSKMRVVAARADGSKGIMLEIEGIETCHRRGSEYLPLRMEENTMSKVEDENWETQAQALLDEVPVLLQVELGRIEMSAAEVARLKKGQLLVLDRSMEDPLLITASGNPIARGELVEVDGQFGIRILEI